MQLRCLSLCLATVLALMGLGAAPPALAAEAAVTISNFQFTPATLTVPVGTTVRWVNQGPSIHSVVGDGFTSDVLPVGQGFAFTFNQTGTFNYACGIHPFMKAAIVVTPAGAPAQTAANVPPPGSGERDLPGGRFFTETSGAAGANAGFAVVDDGAAKLWSEFLRLGGVNGVGYPVSRRFTLGGFLTQAFQKELVQWNAATGQVQFVNVMDMLHDAGKDDWLRTVKQIPPPADASADAGKTFDQVEAQHLALLDSDPALKAAYTAPPNWLDLYGLPLTPPTDMGNVVVVRGQRAALQRWKQDVPWAKAGQVTVANGGDIFKDAGLLPPDAARPGDPSAITASAAPAPAAPAAPPPPAPPPYRYGGY